MHEPVEQNLENYLSGGPQGAVVNAHLQSCRECEQEVSQMREQSQLVQSLRAPSDVEPRAGFYARVLERIEAQRAKATFWSGFLEPAFARRLALASVVLVMLLSAALAVIQHDHAEADLAADHPEALMAVPVATPASLNEDPEQERDVTLVNLATYSAPGIQ